MFVCFLLCYLNLDSILLIKSIEYIQQKIIQHKSVIKLWYQRNKTTFTTGRGILTRVWNMGITWQTPIWCRRGLHMNTYNYSFIGQYKRILWMQWHLSDFIQGCIFQLKLHTFTKQSRSRQKTFWFWLSIYVYLWASLSK